MLSSNRNLILWNLIKYLLSPILLPHILNIFNKSLNNTDFSHIRKRSIIIPLPKISKPTVLGEYRPIALLPIVSKVLKRIVHGRNMTWLTKNNLLDAYQYGFPKGHSTHTALFKIICVVDDIKCNYEKTMVTVAVLFDFSKVIDMVDHRILLSKACELNFFGQMITYGSLSV